jgi:hypothetical protein
MARPAEEVLAAPSALIAGTHSDMPVMCARRGLGTRADKDAERRISRLAGKAFVTL